jgi:myo-inositol-1(or 4)-monophosphatase
MHYGGRAVKPPEDALPVALGAAREAGRVIRERFRTRVRSRRKDGTSVVTAVDRAAEERIIARLRRAFPAHARLGEESGTAAPARASEYAWCIDPLDGTDNFLLGVPFVSVAIALLHRGAPVVAVVHDPLRDETFTATRGGGAFRGAARLRCRPGALTDLSIVAVRHRFFRDGRGRLLGGLPTRKFRCLGSIALELAYAAQGSWHACIAGGARLWDIAAGALLVAEAGGVVLDLAGRPVFPLRAPVAEYGGLRIGLVAGPPAAARTLVRRIRRAPL